MKTLDLRNSSSSESRPFYFIAVGIDPTLKNLPDFIWEMPALEEVLVDENVLQSIQNGKRINKIIDLFLVWRNCQKWSDGQLKKFTMPHINGRIYF